MEFEQASFLQEMQEHGHARELGHLENYFTLCQRQDLYSNFSMYCELSNSCTVDELAYALRTICLQNPILVHTVIPRNWPDHASFYASEEFLSKPVASHEYMRLLDSVRVSDLLMNDQEEYQEVVTKILELFTRSGGKYTSEIFDVVSRIRVPYGDPSKPNWRILCLPGKDKNTWSKFLYISNHCSSDGTSAVNLFKDLSARLSKMPEVLDRSGVIFDYSADFHRLGKLPAPIDERLDYKPPLTYLPRFFANSFVRNRLGYYSKGPVVSRITNPDEGNSVYSHFVHFTPGEVQAIKNKIQRQTSSHCTMTPFLQACWLVAMYKFGKVFSGSMREWFIDVVIPMHTSQLLPADEEIRSMYRYGSNIGGTHYNYLISSLNIGNDKQAFWSLVEYYNNVFCGAKAKGDYLYPLGMLMLDAVCQKSNVDKLAVEDLVGFPRQGVVLSNVGYVKQDHSIQDFRVQDLVFSQTLGSLRHSFTLSACTTDTSGMTLVMCGAYGALPTKKDWINLCELFKSEVLTI
ncbi:LADA_0B10550g1_1 [Lachancea dasiensis]|uniref:LADA_0B10550g1_1 n=1 Tax=Lachancea dasiensis TaxID=1072105 RepID=A0A1G4IW03_9SACH|nr:LADA_0B10550g1_1 [Lachancea dasiensis]